MTDRSNQVLLALTTIVVLAIIVLLGRGEPSASSVAVGPPPTIPDFALAPAVEPPVTASETAPARDPNAPAPPVTVSIVGDVTGEFPLEQALSSGANPMSAFAPRLATADIAIANLDTPIGITGTVDSSTSTVFHAHPALAARLEDTGIDVVSMANEHALDYGEIGAEETLRLLGNAGLDAVGYGQDQASAYAPRVIDVDGRSVAILGLTQILPSPDWQATDTRAGVASADNLDAAIEAVEAAAAQADHVVVMVHWGKELHTCPDSGQVRLARTLANAGADVIAGHHAHVLQGVVSIDGTVVAYGLGNFLVPGRTDATRQTGVLSVTLGAEDGDPSAVWSPGQINDQAEPVPAPSQPPVPEDPGVVIATEGPECGPPS